MNAPDERTARFARRRTLLAGALAAPLAGSRVLCAAPADDVVAGREAVLADAGADVPGDGTTGVDLPGNEAPTGSGPDEAALARFGEAASSLERLQAAVVLQGGEVVFAEAFRGPPVERAVNVKSVSKSLVAALLGCALERGVLDSVRATLGETAPSLVPPGADPRVAALTLEDLVTMRAGLERTSGSNYGAWVSSEDWVRDALSRPFVAEPGTRMLYSTGSFHILAAALALAAGRDLHALADAWLGAPLGIDFLPWTRDPQGRYLGGNEMALSPLEMARVGELYRLGGRWQGERVLAADWVARSFEPRVRSPWSGDGYGYGWFLRRLGRHGAAYARGYGGQFIHVVPGTATVVAITSDISRAARGDGYTDRLHYLVERLVA